MRTHRERRGNGGIWGLPCCFFFLLLMIRTYSECPNACSAHGRCGAFDVCSCYANYMAGDCSERMCQFSLAFVDTPKGDLDSNDLITGADTTIARNSQLYPYGTTELFVNTIDSEGNVLSNTGHEYTECSNKGICNRKIGLCNCVSGFSGSACQHMSCPVSNDDTAGICSGHGVCISASKLASLDNDNSYTLWDADINFGCYCDPGYSGPNCNLRTCKVGFDPNYYDIDSSHRFSNWSYAIITKSSTATITGNYSLRFYDYTGEDWLTAPISYGAICTTIVSALEGLPNNVIPKNTVRCLQFQDFTQIPITDEPAMGRGNAYYGMKYTLAFPSNPGKLQQLEIESYLDGPRPTLYDATPSLTRPLNLAVYPNGFSGENLEYFSLKCLGVDVTLRTAAYYDYFSGITQLEFRLLSRCLGDADGYLNTYSASGRVQGHDYKWDYGTQFNPHIVRLVDRTLLPISDLCAPLSTDYTGSQVNRTHTRTGAHKVICSNDQRPAGFFAAIYYDPILKIFKLFNRPAADYGTATTFSIFTTTGVMSMVSDYSKVFSNPDTPYSRTIFVTNSSMNQTGYSGNIDCTTNGPLSFGSRTCLEKGDKVFFFDPNLNQYSIVTNPKYLNMYAVSKIFVNPLNNPDQSFGGTIVLDMGLNAAWTRGIIDEARAYRFLPPLAHSNLNYEYVAECSNRGNCDNTYGLCTCFTGYTGDACQFIYNIIS